MTGFALLVNVWWIGPGRRKIRVGKKKREACYDSNVWSKRRVAMYHILGWDHHRHLDRCQHCAPSYVLPLKSRR